MPNGVTPPDFSSFPGITDFESAQLGQVFASNTDECPPPQKEKAVPIDAVSELYKFICTYLRALGSPRWMARFFAGLAVTPVIVFNNMVTIAITIMAPAITALASEGLGLIDVFRKAIDPTVANVSEAVLAELLGMDYTAAQLPAGTDVASHIARAGAIGKLFLNTITREISTSGNIEDIKGDVGAANFVGMIINFGVATALLGLTGEIATWGFIKNFRLIGEQVSSGLGLSKQVRIAIKPLMKTLVATPFQWQLNRQYHPQRFTAADVVNPFLGQTMPHDVVLKDLELQGWDTDHAEQLIKFHQKRLSFEDIELLTRWKVFLPDDAQREIRNLGWPDTLAQLLFHIQDLRKSDAAVNSLVDAIEASAVQGHVSVDEFKALLDTLPLTEDTKRFRVQAVQYKTKSTHAHITLAEAQSAFNEGVWTLDQLDSYLAARGYSADDNATLTTLTLLKFAQFEEAKKVAQFTYDQKVKRAQAKGLPVPPLPKILAG